MRRTPVSVVRLLTEVTSPDNPHHVILQLLRVLVHILEILQGQTESGGGQHQPRDLAGQLEVIVTREGEVGVPS